MVVGLTLLSILVGPMQSSDLRLLAYRTAPDVDSVVIDGVRLKRAAGREECVAAVWLSLGKYEVYRSNEPERRDRLKFVLVGDEGAEYSPSVGVLLQYNVATLSFLPGAGDKFSNPTLCAKIEDKVVASWKLPDYPKDKRVIPIEERLVATVPNLLGVSIVGEMVKTVHHFPGRKPSTFMMFYIDVTGGFDPTYEYWVHTKIVETTWRKEPYQDAGGSLFDAPRKTGHSLSSNAAPFADRFRVTGEVEVKRLHDFPVVFAGLRFEKSDGWILCNDARQSFVLPSGVEVVMPEFRRPVEVYGKRLIAQFVLDFPGKTHGLDLSGAENVLTATKGVELKLASVSIEGLGEAKTVGIGSTRWEPRLSIDGTKLESGLKVDVRFVIRHVVPFAKEPFQMLLPVTVVEK